MSSNIESLNRLTIIQAAKGLRSKKFTVKELVHSCLDEIERTDGKVNSFLKVLSKEDLEDEISKAQRKIDNDNAHILTGIPYAAKDLFSTKNIKTTASSKILEDYKPQYESTVTKKLKDVGAILIGKTNLDEFAHGSSTETSAFKVSRCPWDLDRNAGGSSGGSGSAVSAHQTIFAIGTSTAGSIQNPSSICGISGLKGTYGRVSRYGVIAMGSSLDCPGPMCKSAQDAAIVMEVISGEDRNDSTTTPKTVDDYSNFKRNDLNNIKIGYPKSYFKTDMQEGVKDRVEDAVKKLEKLGADIVEVDIMKPEFSVAVYTIVCRSEVSSNLGRYHGTRYGNQPTKSDFDDIFEYFKQSRSMNGFGLEAKRRIMTGTFALSSGYADEFYKKAQKVRTLVIDDFNNVFKKVDLIVSPTTPTVAQKIGAAVENPLYGELADIFACGPAISGLPGISIPCGFTEDLPVGLHIFGPHWSEKLCLDVAKVYQDNTDYHNKLPKIVTEK